MNYEQYIAEMKQTQPEEYAKLLKGYKSEKDLVWEIRHFAAKAVKFYKAVLK